MGHHRASSRSRRSSSGSDGEEPRHHHHHHHHHTVKHDKGGSTTSSHRRRRHKESSGSEDEGPRRSEKPVEPVTPVQAVKELQATATAPVSSTYGVQGHVQYANVPQPPYPYGGPPPPPPPQAYQQQYQTSYQPQYTPMQAAYYPPQPMYGVAYPPQFAPHYAQVQPSAPPSFHEVALRPSASSLAPAYPTSKSQVEVNETVAAPVLAPVEPTPAPVATKEPKIKPVKVSSKSPTKSSSKATFNEVVPSSKSTRAIASSQAPTPAAPTEPFYTPSTPIDHSVTGYDPRGAQQYPQQGLAPTQQPSAPRLPSFYGHLEQETRYYGLQQPQAPQQQQPIQVQGVQHQELWNAHSSPPPPLPPSHPAGEWMQGPDGSPHWITSVPPPPPQQQSYPSQQYQYTPAFPAPPLAPRQMIGVPTAYQGFYGLAPPSMIQRPASAPPAPHVAPHVVHDEPTMTIRAGRPGKEAEGEGEGGSDSGSSSSGSSRSGSSERRKHHHHRHHRRSRSRSRSKGRKHRSRSRSRSKSRHRASKSDEYKSIGKVDPADERRQYAHSEAEKERKLLEERFSTRSRPVGSPATYEDVPQPSRPAMKPRRLSIGQAIRREFNNLLDKPTKPTAPSAPTPVSKAAKDQRVSDWAQSIASSDAGTDDDRPRRKSHRGTPHDVAYKSIPKGGSARLEADPFEAETAGSVASQMYGSWHPRH